MPQQARLALVVVTVAICWVGRACAQAPSNVPPPGFTALFNGKDLAGWKGLVGNPISRARMSPEQLAEAQRKADAELARHWKVEDGQIVNDGSGPHLCTVDQYGDFELWVDWKISPGGDSGIYLRGSPQVQIWDPVNGIPDARVGSGGLYNNQVNPSRPLVVADRPAGQWNTFFIRMIGQRVTVKLNDRLVVDNVIMENYWDRKRPIFPVEQIELQTHGNETRFRNIFIRPIPPEEANAALQKTDDSGFVSIFNGKDLEGWVGAVDGYEVRDGILACKAGSGGNLFTKDQYADFAVRFEFRLPPGGNNGLAVRSPLGGNPAYDGMEIQILDDGHPKYATLEPWQYHGSIYGLVPAHRGYLRPTGQWNFEEVIARGSRITVNLNGTIIVDADLSQVKDPDGKHPGMKRISGHLGFAGHNDPVEFRNIRLRRLEH
jgi:hypothetical protein